MFSLTRVQPEPMKRSDEVSEPGLGPEPGPEPGLSSIQYGSSGTFEGDLFLLFYSEAGSRSRIWSGNLLVASLTFRASWMSPGTTRGLQRGTRRPARVRRVDRTRRSNENGRGSSAAWRYTSSAPGATAGTPTLHLSPADKERSRMMEGGMDGWMDGWLGGTFRATSGWLGSRLTAPHSSSVCMSMLTSLWASLDKLQPKTCR